MKHTRNDCFRLELMRISKYNPSTADPASFPRGRDAAEAITNKLAEQYVRWQSKACS